MEETLKISFSDFKNRDVQRNDLKTKEEDSKEVDYEDAIKLAENSFFRNVYQQALEQISMIVKQNREQISSQSNDQLYKHDIQNIIAFTGRRGTGKTSAMVSLAEFLSSHELLIERPKDKGVGTLKDRVSFKLLAEIDATSLDRNVSLIPAILSQIIAQLNDELYCSDFNRKISETKKSTYQEIYKTANQLFNDYIIGMQPSSKSADSSSYLSIASKRLSFEKSFRELIRDYRFKNENFYFIICIDDVDMAPCSHAELLLSIHQYLMIPNIIVFLTANIKFLMPEVQTLFSRNVSPAHDKSEIDRLSTEQTEEYLKKIIPSDNRITLPSWKKKDYISFFPIKVSFYNDLEVEDAKKQMESSYGKLIGSEFIGFIEKKEPFLVAPKELILMMIANRTKVYMDVRGKKYHFFEPSSLRNMYDLFYILYNMNNIVEEYDNRKESNNNYYLHRSQNRKRLLDYIHFTMRRDYHFDEQTSEFLDELIANPIERRGQKIWGYYYQLLDSEEISQKIDAAYGKNFRPTEKFYYKTKNYSFGEFFRILYTASRLEIFDHKFIKFILASYSMALPAFVENEKRIHKEEQYKHLVDLYGSSLIGINWCDELFGCKSSVVTKKYDNVEYSEPIVDRYEANRCSIVVNVDQKTVDKKTSVDVLDIEKLISLLLLSPHWVTGTAIEVEKNNDQWVIKAELDPTSFLINCLLIDDKIRDKYDANEEPMQPGLKIFKYDNKLHTLSELIQDLYGDLSLSKTKYIERYISAQVLIKGTITEIILSYLAQDYRTHHLANMLKHIDLIYNTIKRSITDMVYITSHDVIKKKDRFENKVNPAVIIDEFYKKIIDQLAETDKVYFAKGVGADNSFATRFETSVIVKNVRSMVACTKEKDKISLEATKSNKTKDDEVTLKKVFDDILPFNMYVAYQSEYMTALKGEFADVLEDILPAKKAQKINSSVLDHLGKVSILTITNSAPEEENILNENVHNEIIRAVEEIKQILEK